jgi:hypothetical protein
MRDLESGLNTPYGGGCYPLSGDAALSYVRSRYPEIYDSTYTDANGEHWRPYGNWSDLERIPRQQSFIRKLAALAISKSLGDPFLALELTDNVLKYLKVDQALGRTEINDLVKAFKTVDVNDPTSLEMITLPVVADPDDPNRVIPGDGSDAVVAQLNTFGDSAPKALPAPSQVSVDVVDASGRDLGVAIVKSLGDQGFVAKAKGTATATTAATTATATVTEIRYAPGQLEEAEALLAYLPNAKFVPDPAATKAVKLVIGSDFVNLTLPTTTTTAAGQVAAPTTTAPLPTTTTVPPGQVCGQG